MILTIEQLVLNVDDVTIIKGDFDNDERKISRFQLFKPSTWLLEPIVTTNHNWYVQIWYHKNKQLASFKYMCLNSKRSSEIISDLAVQMKAQLDANNREALDKAFEKVIMEAK
jgi:hypothetical protein